MLYPHQSSLLRRFIAAVCWLIASAGTASTAVIYEEKVDTFDIGVRTGDSAAVWAGISRWGPSANGGHALGTTTGRVQWAYKRAESSRGCTIHDIKVTVQADIMMPGWPYSSRADANTQKFWSCIENVVSVHEQRHAEIWRETAKDINDALRGLSDVMRCEAVENTVNTLAKRIYEEGRTRQTEFDTAESKLTRQQDCAATPKSVKIEAEAKTKEEKPPAVEQAAMEQIPYPMQLKAKPESQDDRPAGFEIAYPTSLPLGALLGGAGIFALFGVTYLIVSAGQAASRRARAEAIANVEASLEDTPAFDPSLSPDRRITPDRRASIRDEVNGPGRRASDFGRRTS